MSHVDLKQSHDKYHIFHISHLPIPHSLKPNHRLNSKDLTNRIHQSHRHQVPQHSHPIPSGTISRCTTTLQSVSRFPIFHLFRSDFPVDEVTITVPWISIRANEGVGSLRDWSQYTVMVRRGWGEIKELWIKRMDRIERRGGWG